MSDTQKPAGKLAGRIALITGASRGVGRAVALGYAREGAHVLLAARTRGALEELDDEIRAFGGAASIIPIDLKDGAKLDALGPTLYERFGRLDVLVANAAELGPLSPLPHVDSKDWRRVFEINVDANWRLIRTLDPILRRSESGRAIFVTCAAARLCTAYFGPYAASKAALEALVRTYAAEIATTGVRANLLDPGLTRTRMRARAFPGEDPMSIKPPEALVPLFVKMAAANYNANGQLEAYDG
jgi:NAD(P)-dependent dehydrogenase (short-subunit alcohol dehydrogenase family)